MRRKASSEAREEQMDTAEFFRFKICSSSQTFTAFRRAVMTVTDQLWCRNLLVKKKWSRQTLSVVMALESE